VDRLNNQLQLIQEEELTEFDPLTGTALIGTSYIIASLAFLFLAIGSTIKALKVDKQLSKRINEILNSGNRWVVHQYPEDIPNAFAVGMGRHIFVTTGLLKILNKREIEAILLHEVHHNKNKDTFKSLAINYSFFYLVTFIALSVPIYPLAVFVFFILIKITSITYNRTYGRYAEISADKFSVEHDYGNDLISALSKLQKTYEKLFRNKPCGKICQMIRKLGEILDVHPPTKKRVEIILRQMDKIDLMSFKKIKDYIARTFKQNG
jgi:Zn-dependent protease with chaperone function